MKQGPLRILGYKSSKEVGRELVEIFFIFSFFILYFRMIFKETLATLIWFYHSTSQKFSIFSD